MALALGKLKAAVVAVNAKVLAVGLIGAVELLSNLYAHSFLNLLKELD